MCAVVATVVLSVDVAFVKAKPAVVISFVCFVVDVVT